MKQISYLQATVCLAACLVWISVTPAHAQSSNHGAYSPFAPPVSAPAPVTPVIPPITVMLPDYASVLYGCAATGGIVIYARVNGGSGGYQYSWSSSNSMGVSIAIAPGGTSIIVSSNFVEASTNIQVIATDSGGRSVASNVLLVTSSNSGNCDSGNN